MTAASVGPRKGFVHPASPRWTALACWLVVAALMLWIRRDAIADLTLYDGDDALRLVQVRDLMAGQSWFDTTQYRINPPAGGMMHWSRLVDLPIALGIGFFGLSTDRATAETIVLALYPMLLLGLLFATAYAWLKSYYERAITHVGLIVLATTASMLFQFVPMRIDHHSWQVVLAVIAMALAVRAPTAFNGALAGLVMANYIAISIEGAAYVALFGAIFAFEWLRDPKTGGRFIGYTGTLAGAAILIVLVTRGPSGIVQSYCDAVSRPYLLALTSVFVVTYTMRRIIGDATIFRRLGILATVGVVGGLAFALGDSACLAGPFEALDPRVRELWYENIREGRPIWEQMPVRQAHLLLTSLVGLAGILLAWRSAPDNEAAMRWRVTLMAALGALIVAIMVFRTISLAHIFALPGIAWLLWAAMRHARAMANPLPRILATIGVFALAPLSLNAASSWALDRSDPDTSDSADADEIEALHPCFENDAMGQIRGLPTGLVFAPLDIGPFILAETGHSVVATGHHRNQQAMRTVIDGFTAVPEDARQVIEATRARYVVQCSGAPEIANYRRDNEGGLAAMLQDGAIPDWLKPLAAPADAPVRIYRVRNPG